MCLSIALRNTSFNVMCTPTASAEVSLDPRKYKEIMDLFKLQYMLGKFWPALENAIWC